MEYRFDPNVRYAKTHEWVRVEGEEAIVGISDYAQHELSDVVYVELPEVGSIVQQGKACAVVESVKTAEDVYAPISGEVIAINEALRDKPELVNQDPFGAAWFFRVKMSDPSEVNALMDAAAYQRHVESEERR
ncbi:MAG: glycine cleavage system protein GcvH [Anaerolineae bacterium]|nr:glycine cleavage system protein GcvH [Anaerolineae bacterium]MDW8099466.1 glycine cleavage system protein GcvH [Anaerolineae bacterium]